MSMLLMVKAMQTKVGNPLRKLVLIKLADNANDQGECWPSYQYIADQCEVSRRSVISHVKALESCGLIKTIHREGPKGNTSNLFRLCIPSESLSLGGESPALPPSESLAPRTSHSLEPSINPYSKRTVCPYEDIKNIYCEELPMLTGCRKMDAKTKKQILAIWKSEEQHQSLDFWRMYFQSIKRLTNRMPNWAGEVDGTKHGTLELLTRDKIFARSVNELIDQGIWK